MLMISVAATALFGRPSPTLVAQITGTARVRGDCLTSANIGTVFGDFCARNGVSSLRRALFSASLCLQPLRAARNRSPGLRLMQGL